MRPSGNCQQSGNQVESKAPILSLRKRSIDLVRQAQFAACSYLGFDPYEEKHKHGLAHRQVLVSDGSIPLELHLHHHHHHNCREAEDVLKKASDIRSSGGSPLAVGNLLSICDHIQLFQDAWQGNIRVDEKSQKFMLQGSLIKRDATYAGYEGGMSINSDKRDLTERTFTERCWSGRGASTASPITHSKITGNELQHTNREARISHWECRVIQEDNLNKGHGIGFRPIGKGQSSSSSDDAVDFTGKNTDFGWKPASKKESSSHHSNSNDGLKIDRNTNDLNVTTFSESIRNSEPTLTKKNTSFNDVEESYGKVYSGSDVTSCAYSDRRILNNQQQKLQKSSDNVIRLPSMSPRSSLRQLPRNSAYQEGCNLLNYGKSKPNLEMMSLHMNNMGVSNIRETGLFGCYECTCQPSAQVQQEGFMTTNGRAEVLKDSLESSNMKNRYDRREKIIILDESENDEGRNVHSMGNTNENIVSKKLMVAEGKNDNSSTSMKVSEERDGSLVWDEARMKRGQCPSAKSSIEFSTKMKLRGDHSLIHDCVPVDNEQARGGTCKEFCSDDRIKKLPTNGAFRSIEKTHSEDSFPTIYSHEASRVELESQKMRMNKSPMIMDKGLLNKKSHWECRVFDTPGNSMQEKERKVLDFELEARIAAEEKARKYEASAEAAENRLLQLLEERTKLHRKFDEEVEQKEVERMHLNRLFEQEKIKSEAAKKELQDLKQKFVSLISKVPMSSRVTYDDEPRGAKSSTPRPAHKTSETLDERDVTEKKEQSQVCMPNHKSECMNIPQKVEQIEENKLERGMVFRNKEPYTLQKMQLQEMQLKTDEKAFQELESKLKRVENENFPLEDSAGLVKDDAQVLKISEQATQTSTECDGVYEKFNCVYQSPIFEHSQSRFKSGRTSHEEVSKEDSDDKLLRGKEHNKVHMDLEICQLVEELEGIEPDMLSHKISETNGNFVTAVDEKVGQINEIDTTNEVLRRKLQEKDDQLNCILAQHAKDLQKAQNSCTQLHQLNKQLETNLSMSETRLSELQKQYNELLASAGFAESQLKDAIKDVEESRRTADELRCTLSDSEKCVIELKKCAENKELQIREIARKINKLELERDSGEKEKADLLMKLAEARKEVDEQTTRVAEYSSINEELLEFAQKKENEVTSMRQQLQTLQQQNLEKTNAITKLEFELEKQRKEINNMQKSYSSVESEQENIKSKLAEKNILLLQQEGTISSLTKQMGDIMEIRDSMLEEAAQFHDYLQNAKFKEFEMEGKLKQSSLVINDLEEKILWMDKDSLKAKLELSDLKHQHSALQNLIIQKEDEAIEMKRAVSDLRKKVQELEEEVLMKEGQIAIISSQNGESYESF